MKEAKKYKITGRVQGIGYRYFASNLANRIGIYGYVKNMFDGSVEVYAIGSKEQLENLRSGLIQGPSFSRVDNVLEEDVRIENSYYNFSVKF